MTGAVAGLALLAQAVVGVGGGAAHTTISGGLAAATDGDTVLVAPGIYREHPVITKPVTLIGQAGATIDGGGRGIVLTVRAPATITGFSIRASGAQQVSEDAGILAERADGLVVERNHFDDVLFGVYVKQSRAPVIRDNTITGKDLPVAQRGDGIRLWYSNGGVITGNQVDRVRDVVIWFSDSTFVADNHVAASRYGLHYMYSDHNRFERNEFIHNSVGAFLMYSKDIVFEENVFADARGTTGRGLGFKDTDNIRADDNVMVRNAIGISIDNSPTSVGVTNRFRSNVIAFNDVGVTLLPSVHSNVFEGNTFLDNVRSITVTGAGTATANMWRDNYWAEYAGFDRNRDRRGDTPFVYERLSDDLFAKHEPLQLFHLSLATSALNTLSRVFPLLQPTAIAIDSLPRLDKPLRLRAEAREPTGKGSLEAVGFLGAAFLAAGLVMALRRPGRRAR